MPKTSTVSPLMRAFAKDVTIRLGMINVTGDLYPVQRASKDVESHWASPDHNPVKRAWHDPITNKFYTEGELSKSVTGETGDAKIVDTAALKAIRESPMDAKLMDVTIHHAEEVESASFPSAHSPYVFTPTTFAARAAGYIARAINDNPQYAMMGVCNLRGNEGLYRIVVWRGQLVFQRYCFAADVQPHTPAELVDACKETLMFGKVMEKMAEPFNAETYRNEQIERVRAAVAVLEVTGALTPVKVKQAEDNVNDALASMLEAMSA